ncbi:MAG TPA: hypothetical protein DCS63_07550 [Elusimicrobia bacterium]|nr:hypothetical protein [Elusimicrobiota bacterium]
MSDLTVIPVPQELDLCISHRCNMACKYCYSPAKTKASSGSELILGNSLVLTTRQALAGIRKYMNCLAPGALDKIAISGGEPLLCPHLLRGLMGVKDSRSGNHITMELFTNGLLLDPETACFLIGGGVRIRLSLDGGLATHNTNRVDLSGAGTFTRVLSNLKNIPPEFRRKIVLSPVVSKKRVRNFARDMSFLCGLGAGEVKASFAWGDIWTREDLKILKRQLRDVSDLFRSSTGPACVPAFSHSDSIDQKIICEGGEISLGPDATFYPSSAVSSSPLISLPSFVGKYSLGNIRSGLSAQKTLVERKRVYSSLKKNGCLPYLKVSLSICSIISRFYSCEISGTDLKKAFASAARLGTVLRDTCSSVPGQRSRKTGSKAILVEAPVSRSSHCVRGGRC